MNTKHHSRKHGMTTDFTSMRKKGIQNFLYQVLHHEFPLNLQRLNCNISQFDTTHLLIVLMNKPRTNTFPVPP